MKKRIYFISDLVLAAGLALIVFVIIAATFISYFRQHQMLNYFSITASLSGLFVLIMGIKYTKRIHHIFVGFELLFWGVAIFLLIRDYIPYTFPQYWPMIGVVSGIFLFIAGFIKFKKILFGYFIPSILLFLLGLWYMLFSFKIIEIPFYYVAIVGGPLFFIMSAIFIIGFFLLQKKYTNLIKPDDNAVELDSEFAEAETEDDDNN